MRQDVSYVEPTAGRKARRWSIARLPSLIHTIFVNLLLSLKLKLAMNVLTEEDPVASG